jgi:predicted nucleotidyltransferase
MPVRSLNTSVLRWPDQRQVQAALAEWSRRVRREDARVVRVGYAGSYARGDWGVGSDVDIVVLLREAREPFIERARRFDATALSVPADVLVYTQEEWASLVARGSEFRPTVWIEDDPL